MSNKSYKPDSKIINSGQQKRSDQKTKKIEKGVATPVSSYKLNKPKPKPKKKT